MWTSKIDDVRPGGEGPSSIKQPSTTPERKRAPASSEASRSEGIGELELRQQFPSGVIGAEWTSKIDDLRPLPPLQRVLR